MQRDSNITTLEYRKKSKSKYFALVEQVSIISTSVGHHTEHVIYDRHSSSQHP